MSRGRIPSVNASLIHEARMVLQQFILGRQQRGFYSTPFSEARARVSTKPPVCNHPVLKCCFCVDVSTDAESVINGYSVCARHEPRARSIIAVTGP